MKVSREQADANHERIVDVASRMFREKGFDGVSVAELMTAAGLTHGGFYGHFGSKDDLVSEAATRAFDRSGEAWTSIGSDSDKPFSALVDRYLDEAKLSKPGTACMFAMLAPEASRRGRGVKHVFADGFRSLTAHPRRASSVGCEEQGARHLDCGFLGDGRGAGAGAIGR